MNLSGNVGPWAVDGIGDSAPVERCQWLPSSEPSRERQTWHGLEIILTQFYDSNQQSSINCNCDCDQDMLLCSNNQKMTQPTTKPSHATFTCFQAPESARGDTSGLSHSLWYTRGYFLSLFYILPLSFSLLHPSFPHSIPSQKNHIFWLSVWDDEITWN